MILTRFNSTATDSAPSAREDCEMQMVERKMSEFTLSLGTCQATSKVKE